LELKESVPTGDDKDGSTTSNGEAGERDVMGVDDVNVKVNPTSNKSKSAKLAK
jgi:hypothetical protein